MFNPHIYAKILLIFLPFLKKINQTALVANKQSKCSGGDIRLHIVGIGQVRQVRTRSVMPNTMFQQRRRNGTETWRRHSCQCEHLRLFKHEKILLNGNIPRRNGNLTDCVNRTSCRNMLLWVFLEFSWTKETSLRKSCTVRSRQDIWNRHINCARRI